MKEITPFKIGEESYLAVVVDRNAYSFRYKIMPDNSKVFVGSIKDEDDHVGTMYCNHVPTSYFILGEITKDPVYGAKTPIFISSLKNVISDRLGSWDFNSPVFWQSLKLKVLPKDKKLIILKQE